MRKLFFICCLLAIAAAGCGYKLSGAKSALPEGVHTIAIKPFENRTLEPDAGVMAAEALQREIMRRKTVKLAPVGKADAVLEGVVEEITLDPQGYDELGLTTAYRAKIKVSAKLIRGGESIWKSGDISDIEEIALDTTIADNDIRRRKAVLAIMDDIAEKLHIAMVEGW